MNLKTLHEKLLNQYKTAYPEYFGHYIKIEVEISNISNTRIKYRIFAMYYLTSEMYNKENNTISFHVESHLIKKLISDFSLQLFDLKNFKPIVED